AAVDEVGRAGARTGLRRPDDQPLDGHGAGVAQRQPSTGGGARHRVEDPEDGSAAAVRGLAAAAGGGDAGGAVLGRVVEHDLADLEDVAGIGGLGVDTRQRDPGQRHHHGQDHGGQGYGGQAEEL